VTKKPKAKPLESETHSALLGDLESIRTLLDTSAEPVPNVEETDDVPVLEDMVEGAFTVNESNLTSRTSFDDGSTTGKSGLADATIKVLLGDEWRNEARKIIADARANAKGAGGQWSAAQLNALNESLKVRIDRTLDDWLVEMLNARIDDLRSKLLAMLENELEQFTRTFTDPDSDGQ
jgi:hypothetical protein